MNQNKIYISEYTGEDMSGETSHIVIVVAASSVEVAKEYVKNKVGIKVEPTWLMNATYPTIYTSNGNAPEQIQAKILYNGNCHF